MSQNVTLTRTESGAATNWQEKLGSLLIKPADAVKSLERRRQAQLIAGLTLAFLIVSIFAMGRNLFLDTGFPPAVAIMILVIASSTYAVSRTRFYIISGALATSLVFIINWGSALADQFPSESSLYFFIISILLSSLLFSFRITLLVTILAIPSIILIPSVAPSAGLGMDASISATVLTTIVGVLLLVFIRYRDTLENDRQAVLRRSQEQLQAVMDNSNAVIYIKDLDGAYQFVNQEYLRLFDLSDRQVIDKSDGDIFSGEMLDKVTHLDQRVVQENRLMSREEAYTAPDQTQRNFITSKFPLRDPDGEPYAICGISTDITKQKQVEEDLRTNEARLREAQRIARLGIWEWCVQDDSFFWSEDSYRLLGLDPGTAPTYEAFIETIHPDERERVRQMISETVQTGDPYVTEMRYIRADGDTRYALVRGRLEKSTEGNSDRLLGTTLDITERKLAELEREKLIEDLRVAKRLADENSRVKSEFLSTMSHELRTPMNAIEGFTSIMLRKMGGAEYNEKTERYIGKVHSNSKRLLNLINDFLDLSRIESGRVELAHLPISPKDMAQRWRDVFEGVAIEKGIAFDVTVDANLPETIYGDEESLSKITINLLSNAFKFTDKGMVGLELGRDADHMTIIVSDTGIGIPPHAREYIFDEFRQVDQTSTRQHGGTGLGLAIVSKLVRAMNGTISLESEVDGGSTFTIRVPMKTEPIPEKA